MQDSKPRALILDDDPWLSALLQLRLESHVPGIEVTSRTTPDTSGEFDVYFVDNRFGDSEFATELVLEIRRDVPGALVVVFSAALERPDLFELIEADCDLVCEKANNDELDRMLAEVAKRLQRSSSSQRRAGFYSTVRALSDLIQQLHGSVRRSSMEPPR